MIGLGLGAGCIAGECTAAGPHFLASEILTAAIIIVPLLTATILVTVAVFGSTKSSDRVFRLLRWFSHKEEPQRPSPGRHPVCPRHGCAQNRTFCVRLQADQARSLPAPNRQAGRSLG